QIDSNIGISPLKPMNELHGCNIFRRTRTRRGKRSTEHFERNRARIVGHGAGLKSQQCTERQVCKTGFGQRHGNRRVVWLERVFTVSYHLQGVRIRIRPKLSKQDEWFEVEVFS